MCNSEKKENIVKCKECWLFRVLNRISREFEAMGDDVKRTIDIDIKVNRKIDESLGLSSKIENAKRFL